MTNPSEGLLTTTEGVDEGSAASTVEGPGSGASDAEGPGPGHGPDLPRDEHGGADGPAAPYVVESRESREAKAADTGQQLSAGEG
ncbi:MAG: hypothetical protein JWN88_1244 [Frankiales bacterium]|jgi:hypothetical protein|nr:hypothetical protein [Frankiales bacterium]